MRPTSLRHAAAAAFLLMALAIPASAGQIRVRIVGQTFDPPAVTANVGDQVVWAWNTSSHTVTSGNPDFADQTGDGLFRNTMVSLGVANGMFSWKVTGSGTKTYYCFPHSPDMAGSITITGAPVATADFRITEVEFGANGAADRVQIANLGDATARIGGFRLSSVTGASSVIPLATDPNMAPGARLTIHLNASGANTATDIYFPAHPELDTFGSFALYVPNNSSTGSTSAASLSNVNQIVDYVEWGSPGQAAEPNRGTAEAAAIWLLGDVVNSDAQMPPGGNGYSISFCGSRADRGSSFWQITTPNFGSNPICTTPTRTTTWGQVKTLYR